MLDVVTFKKKHLVVQFLKNGRWSKGLEFDSCMNAATTVSAGTMSSSVEEELECQFSLIYWQTFLTNDLELVSSLDVDLWLHMNKFVIVKGYL